MNYQKIYNNLIESAKLRPDISFLNGYTEIHHIIPKSMGGSDESNNLVKLTAREHFIAHWLLYRIYKNSSMAFAFHSMTMKDKNQKQRYFNSKGYEIAKKALSQSRKGTKASLETRKKMSKIHKGNKVNVGRKASLETKKKMSEAHKGNTRRKGIPHSPETKRKISESGKKRYLKKKLCQ